MKRLCTGSVTETMDGKGTREAKARGGVEMGDWRLVGVAAAHLKRKTWRRHAATPFVPFLLEARTS